MTQLTGFLLYLYFELYFGELSKIQTQHTCRAASSMKIKTALTKYVLLQERMQPTIQKLHLHKFTETYILRDY